ncbi:sensor histidine kinase [Flavobacteriaceae bacterium M23B6Z8]
MKKPTKLKWLLFVLVCFIIFSCNSKKSGLRDNFSRERDSINLYIQLSDDESLSAIDRLNYAEAAVPKARSIGEDSLYIKSLINLAKVNFYQGNIDEYKALSLRAKEYSEKVKDSFGIGKAHNYLAIYYMNTDRNDSAYYHFNEAVSVLYRINDESLLATSLLNMAIIQKNEKDFIEGEVTSIEAMKIYTELEDYESLSSLYNNLGIISNELERYDKAIEYHSKSLDYAIKAGEDYKSQITSLNNLGVVYENQEEYAKAIEYYTRALTFKSLPDESPKLHAMLLDNLAHARFLSGDKANLPDEYFVPLRIRDSIDDTVGKIVNNVHIAEYFLAEKDTATAKEYVTAALKLAEVNKSYGDMLTPLSLLSDIDNGQDGLLAAKKYIRISDSLQNAERKIRNQFARIRFETDEIEQKNKEISKQKDLFIAISAVLLMFGVFIYIIRKQQEKNKELKFSKAQQEKNEEIYNLMLSQQRKLEEGRQQEKKRISQELHDGVLSKLFGTRLNLDSLNLKNDEQTIQTRTKYIDELKSIEQEIRQISHDLNTEIYDSNLGYTEVISNLIASQAQLGNLEYKFQSDSQISWEAISNKVKIHLYRIIQEALQNINKHAQAKNIKLTFKKDNESLRIDISDDGVGFDNHKIKNGIGLKNIKSRVKEIGGKLQLDSAVGGGTNININISV